MKKAKKVGILGGTFRPIHIGHLLMAETARDSFGLDSVLLMPNGNPPHKSIENSEDSRHRMNMVVLATKNSNEVYPSSFELQREGVIYTYHTLELLKKENPQNTYYFILGADSLQDMKNWKCVDKICRYAIILVATRGELDEEQVAQESAFLKEHYQAEIHMLDMPNISISSTDIRERIRSGRSIKYLVPSVVEAYLRSNHLYENTKE
ncbi:MAG: nicotinate-nucleotide adenylyltransferase [Lachnospiraceae bacterium]|nr:nicotinate-nucleotide adenylyltransferase [Lachnospiraceae bacterium]